MKKIVGILIVMAVAVLMLLPSAACSAPQSYRISYLRTTSTSAAYATFVAEADAIKKEYPNIDVTLVESSGARDCLNNYLKGQADFSYAGSNDANAVWTGTLDFQGKQSQDMRTGWVGWHGNVISFVVTVDSGVNSLSDLNGKKFAIQLGGSSGAIAKLLFDALGIKPDLQTMELGSMVDAVKAKAVVGAAMPGRASAQTLDIAAAMKIKYLEVSNDDIAKGNAKYPGQFLGEMMDRTKWPQPPDKDWQTLVFSLQTIFRPNVPDEIVYDIVRACYLHRTDIAKTYGGVAFYADFPKYTLTDTIVPLHPGVVKFFKDDLKMTIPDKMLPPSK